MRRHGRTVALITLLGLGAWALRRSGVLGGDPWDPLTLRVWVQASGIWGPVLYVVIATLMPLFAPYPLGLTWVAGALFGWGKGGALVALSGLGSAFVGYTAGKFLGGALWTRRPRLQARADSRLHLIAAGTVGADSGWRTVAFLRVTVPWDFVSYWAGACRLPLGPYLGGTAVALLPVSFGYAYVAAAFAEGEGRRLALAVPLCLGMVFGPLWFLERRASTKAGLRGG